MLLLAGIEAAAQLGFTELSLLLSAFLVFAGRVLLGLVVFVLGSLLAGVVADAVRGSTVPNGAALAPVARVAVLALASVMALSQMGIAQEIVVLAFAMTLGSAAVAAALAFGVGGRDAARELLRRWVRTGPPPSNGGGTSHGPII